MYAHVFLVCAPPRQLTEEHKRLSVEEESLWLRIRSLTLRLIASLALLIHAPLPRNSDKTNENGVMDNAMGLNLLSQLEQTLQAAAQMAEKPTQVRIPTHWGRPVYICEMSFI